MSLALLVLDGHHKGKEIPLKKDFIFGQAEFSDEEMGNSHAKIGLDRNFSWNISGLDGNKVRIGSGESEQISLMLGLVFHLGQTGFKVVEANSLSYHHWEDAIKSWLSEQSWESRPSADFFFFLYPLRMTFLQGPQSDEFYTLSYGPRTMGFNNMDLNLKDPLMPKNLVRFFQVGESIYIENLASDKALINKKPFEQHVIADGDKLYFGTNQIEFNILR